MAQKKQNLPPDEDEYIIGECSVCDIDDIIGTDEDLCVQYFSEPEVEYDYGYNFITAVKQNCRKGYFIGVGRFFKKDGRWGKEYALKEYAVYQEKDAYIAHHALFNYLLTYAKEKGCSRIICKNKGGNTLFWQYLEQNGFEETSEEWTFSLPDAEMCEADKMVLPKENQALGFEELFFLREQGFAPDAEKCVFRYEGEWIFVDRKTGVCDFSQGFRVMGDVPFTVKGRRELGILHCACQLLEMGIQKPICIYPEGERTSDTVPDILADGCGVFVDKDFAGMREEYSFFVKLKQEGKMQKVGYYHYHFNLEVGGRYDSLGFRTLK